MVCGRRRVMRKGLLTELVVVFEDAKEIGDGTGNSDTILARDARLNGLRDEVLALLREGDRLKRRAEGPPSSSKRRVLEHERTPEGHINNCAVANGCPEAECQVCSGKCPNRMLAALGSPSGASSRSERPRARPRVKDAP
jgi:hypothetical protein